MTPELGEDKEELRYAEQATRVRAAECKRVKDLEKERKQKRAWALQRGQEQSAVQERASVPVRLVFCSPRAALEERAQALEASGTC